MKKILVPTDFSDASATALDYARAFAKDINAEIKVVHVYHPSFDPAAPTLIQPIAGIPEVKKAALTQFLSRSSSLYDSGETMTRIDSDLVIGFPTEEILKESRSGNVDYIVMGTTGHGGAFERMFGGVASDVSQKAECPVILVPNGRLYEGFKSIAYGSDFLSMDPSTVERLVRFGKRFNANFHFVHVDTNSDDEDQESLNERIYEILFGKKDPDFSFEIVTVKSESIEDGLLEYCDQNEVDLLVLVAKRRGFWGGLFHKSTTKRVALKPQQPVLFYHIQ